MPAAPPLLLATPDFAALAGATDRHAVVACDCAVATAAPPLPRASLRTMRRGAEELRLGTRQWRLDEDAYLFVTNGAALRGRYLGDAWVSPLLVVFSSAALAQAQAAPDAEPSTAAPLDLPVTLHPHGGAVTKTLLQLERALHAGVADALWWDEQLLRLLGAALDAEHALRRRESALLGRKPATRRELLRRVLLASDYIQSRYDEPLTLHDIAGAAHLSEFHLVRLFQRAHGLTPHAYLTRKRVAVALRLLAQTQLGLAEIADRAGLGTRSSLFRHLRRDQGSGAAALRTRSRPSPSATACSTSA